ncbi:MAG: tetratricopeptide repeat protein, partial [Stellaceae bacterium]
MRSAASGGGRRVGRFGAWRLLPALALAAFGGPAAAAPQSADDFLIVDCLLPAQIRQLGLNHTFLAPRQAIRTSENECAVRGGEFTRGDAGGPAGLRMWLPQAQAGDATAETYVGEIFERGLAGRPDYAAAAVWYKRAADQGNAKAAIALGALMEQGLGVPKNPAGAARLFRRAAGLPEELPGDSEKVAKLSSQLASANAAGALNQRRIAKQTAELRQLRRQLDRREADEKRDRGQLADLERRLATARRAAPSGSSDPHLKAALAARERELGESKALVDRLGAELAGAQAGAAQSSATGNRLQRELEDTRADVAAKLAEAARLRDALDAAQN